MGNNDSFCPQTHVYMRWFYTEYNRYVYKLAWQANSNPNDVDDLVQEVWMRLCSKAHYLIDFSKKRHLSYISATVKNTAISMARKYTSEYPLEFAQTISYDEAEILNTLFDRQVIIKRFHEVWKLVPPDTRELLERKYILIETDKEIARDMGINTNSVRTYLSRARKIACVILSQHKDDLI